MRRKQKSPGQFEAPPPLRNPGFQKLRTCSSHLGHRHSVALCPRTLRAWPVEAQDQRPIWSWPSVARRTAREFSDSRSAPSLSPHTWICSSVRGFSDFQCGFLKSETCDPGLASSLALSGAGLQHPAPMSFRTTPRAGCQRGVWADYPPDQKDTCCLESRK